PGELAGLAARMREVLVEHAPQYAGAPGVERGAGAGAEQEAGEVEPALLVVGRPLALGGDLDEGVEQGARGGDRPVVAARVEHGLEIAGQGGEAVTGLERALDPRAGLLDLRVSLGGGGRRRAAARAHVERELPGLGGPTPRLAALDARDLERTELGDVDL